MPFSSRQGHWWRLFTLTPFSSASKLFLHSCQLSLYSTDLYVVCMHRVVFWQLLLMQPWTFSVSSSLWVCVPSEKEEQEGTPVMVLCWCGGFLPTSAHHSWGFQSRPRQCLTCLNPSVYPQSCILNGAKCAVPFPATENGITVNEETCSQSKHLGGP